MKLEEALPLLVTCCGKKVSEIVQTLPADLRTNKGNVGQLLELYVGLQLSGRHTDFEDAELKTNKTFANGKPAETIFITQILSGIDTLLAPRPVPFEQSALLRKIQNLVIVQAIKEGTEVDWRFGHVYHVDLREDARIRDQLERDYYTICAGLRDHVQESGSIHTTNGELIQVRSKDAQPYSPIYSQVFGRQVANKNHAFYFKKDFILALQAGGSRYRVCTCRN